MKPAIPNVLAGRYASTAMATLWSPAHKVVLERQLWLAVLRAQAELGVDVPAGAIDAYQAVVDRGTDAVDLDSHRRPRTGHAARRQGAHRGVRRARRARADPQGHDQPRPDRERRAAAGPLVAASRPDEDARRPGPPRPPRRRVRRAGDGRPLAQRRRAGHHARQAVRDRGRRAAGRAAAASTT